jgi:citrate lyase subunit beta/citryl-CoA lyase
MINPAHPDEALFRGEKPFPALPVCEHYAGGEKQMLKALELQAELGRTFDLTCDCEDGAPVGGERAHAEMIVRVLNSPANRFGMAGVRIHDFEHPAWKQDLEIILGGAGERVAYVTLPKSTSASQVSAMVEHAQKQVQRAGTARGLAIHVLIETQGALREVWEVAALPWVQTLDFGLLDFISAHHGAIPSQAMRSPGQFEHHLLVRAKTEVVAAALANGVVPSHNISLEMRNSHNTYQDAWRARHEFGFLRMYSIHPEQIKPIVDAMKPGSAEVNRACEILLAAQQAHWGPVQLQGDMYDRAAYRYYWDLLRKAKACAVAIPAAADAAFFGEATA